MPNNPNHQLKDFTVNTNQQVPKHSLKPTIYVNALHHQHRHTST
jgi:hypothetical protein